MVTSFCGLRPEGDQGGKGTGARSVWKGEAGGYPLSGCLISTGMDGQVLEGRRGRAGGRRRKGLCHVALVFSSEWSKVSIFTLLPSCQINLCATVFFQ